MNIQSYIINTTVLSLTVNADTLIRCCHHLVADERVYNVEFYRSCMKKGLYELRIEVYDTESANILRDELFDIEQKSSIALEDYEFYQENDNEMPF